MNSTKVCATFSSENCSPNSDKIHNISVINDTLVKGNCYDENSRAEDYSNIAVNNCVADEQTYPESKKTSIETDGSENNLKHSLFDGEILTSGKNVEISVNGNVSEKNVSEMQEYSSMSSGAISELYRTTMYSPITDGISSANKETGNEIISRNGIHGTINPVSIINENGSYLDGVEQYLTPERHSKSKAADELKLIGHKNENCKRRALPIASSSLSKYRDKNGYCKISRRLPYSKSYDSIFKKSSTVTDLVVSESSCIFAPIGNGTSTPLLKRFDIFTLPPLTPIQCADETSEADGLGSLSSSTPVLRRKSLIRCKSEDHKVSSLCPKNVRYESPESVPPVRKSYVIKPEQLSNYCSSVDNLHMVNKGRKVSRKINFTREENQSDIESESSKICDESIELSQASILSQDECELVCSVGWSFKENIIEFLEDRFYSLITKNEEERTRNTLLYRQRYVQKIEILLGYLMQHISKEQKNETDLKVMTDNIFKYIKVDVNARIWECVDNKLQFDYSYVMNAGLDLLEPNNSLYSQRSLNTLFKCNR